MQLFAQKLNIAMKYNSWNSAVHCTFNIGRNIVDENTLSGNQLEPVQCPEVVIRMGFHNLFIGRDDLTVKGLPARDLGQYSC